METFTRANSTSALGTAETGQPWGTPFFDGAGTSAPTFGINSGGGYVSTEGDAGGSVFLNHDLGTSDMRISVRLHWVTGGNLGIIYRGNGTASKAGSRYYLLRISSTNLALFTWNGSTHTQIGAYAFTPTTATTYRVEAILVGSSHRIILDGVERISVTNATYSGGYVGLRTGNTTGTPAVNKRWDNLIVQR